MDDLLDNAPCGFARFTDDGTIVTVNTTLAHMLGYERGELEGQHIETLLSRASCIFYQSYVFPTLKLQGIVEEALIRLRPKTGAAVPVLANAKRQERSGVAVIDCVCMGMRQRSRYEEVLLQAQKTAQQAMIAESSARAEAERASYAKSAFLANMSHELRTPLNAVLGLSEALREEVYGLVTARQTSALRTIEESGQHLLSLINDILDLSKISAGKFDLAIDSIPVQEIVQASLAFVRQSAQSKQIMIQTSFDERARYVQADTRRFKQILVNLLSNAVKFTPDRGTIGLDVTADETQHHVQFTVWDTGIGIAPEHMDRLFQPFVQLDDKLSRQYEGTGLGLSLVYNLVELHGGSVHVSSEVGVGSRFSVVLSGGAQPFVAERASRNAHSEPTAELATQAAEVVADAVFTTAPEPPASIQPATILLAEDNEANIVMLVDYLSSLNYQVVVVRNGQEAVKLARELRPAMILMDVQMPVMDGLEATRRIRDEANLADVPILALTALAMPGDRQRCLEAGANDYLSKPVSLRMLAKLVAFYIGSRPTDRCD